MNRKHIYRWFAASVLGISLAAPSRADRDVGNIAVIQGDPVMVQPGELFDLVGRSITFTPAGTGYTVTNDPLLMEASLGTNLALTDNGSAEVAIPFPFLFFGVQFDSLFANANGNVSFTAASSLIHFNNGSRTNIGTGATLLTNFAAGLPRIAVLWQDWQPVSGGVFANVLADRVVITWNNVTLAGAGSTGTFQLVVFDSGVLRLSYQSVPATPSGGYLAGASPGGQSEFQVTTVNLSAGGASLSAVPFAEPLAQVFGSMTSPLVHIPAVARRYFAGHQDDVDQLVLFGNFNFAHYGFAYELTTRQTVSGIGLGFNNGSSFFGSAGRLQGMLNMGFLGSYPTDPDTTFLGTNSALDILGQEAGHQWLAFVWYNDNGVCSSELLGRDFAHWSFFHDTDASAVEGNKWQDNANGTFTSIESTARYSPLDQYLMGLRGGAGVPPFYFVDNPSGTTRTPSSAPAVGITTNGTRHDVTLQDVIACEGPRFPASGFSQVNTGSNWRQAFILIERQGTTATAAELTKLDLLRDRWEGYFYAATSGLGSVDTTVNPALADLATTAVSNPPASAVATSVFNVSSSVINQGTAAAAATTQRFYLSFDQFKTSTDRLLTGTRAVPALAIGASSGGSLNLTVPNGTPIGTYYLLACADDLDVVAEDGVVNNCLASSTQITVGVPDLSVTAVSTASIAVAPGVPFSVTDTTANLSAFNVPASNTGYRVSADTVITTSDTRLTGTRVVPALAGNASSTAALNVTVPTTVADGLYYLAVCADVTATLPESNEANNCALAPQQISVSRADLRVTSISAAPASVVAGGSFTMTDTTTNSGAGAAAGSLTRYRLSLDPVITTGDIAMSSRSLGVLAAGASSSAATSVTMSSSAAAGTYYLGACADDAAAVSESNESNNCTLASGQVVLLKRDLAVTALSSPPASAAAGASFSVTDTTTNIGTAPSTSSSTRYRLSLDNIITSADVAMTPLRSVPGLVAGAGSTGSVSALIPAAITPGVYFLGACADDTNTNAENSETNNCLVAAGTIAIGLADLVVSAVTDPPPVAAPGSSFDTGDTTANLGSGSAAAGVTRYYLSLDTLFDVGDVALSGDRAVPALAAGAASSGANTVSVPLGLAAGSYYLLACADAGASTAEGNESNNCAAAAASVLIQP
jgi:subtilase family serine protease